MRPNRLRTLWQQGGAALNGWLWIPSAYSAEIMAHAGFDSLTIDMQHGLMGFESTVAMLQAISTTDVTPVVRVPWNDPAMIMRVADAGAYGIICPLVNSRAECEAFVGACRYPPAGYRSYGANRVRLYAGRDYTDHAAEALVTFAMIETAEALARVDEIAGTPGLDALYVGPADLSLSLGGAQRVDYTDPMLLDALATILTAAKRHGVAVGLHCGTAAYARRAVDMGFQFVTPSSDSSYLEAQAAAVVAEFRQQGASRSASTY